MKKFSFRVKILALTLLFFSSGLFSEERLFSFSAGISTGIPIYGSQELQNNKKDFDHDARVIIGTLGTVNLNPMEEFTFFIGSDVLCDFSWKGGQHLNFIHVTFPLGVKVYPGLGGLNLALAYTLGFRSDFIKSDSLGVQTKTDAWGNGFRFYLEYNFAHKGKSNHLPSCGLYWNLMPRGNNDYDNIIALYLVANL